MKKSILNVFEGAEPVKKEQAKRESEWDVDELLGKAPRGFHRRWEWYQKIAGKEGEERKSKE